MKWTLVQTVDHLSFTLLVTAHFRHSTASSGIRPSTIVQHPDTGTYDERLPWCARRLTARPQRSLYNVLEKTPTTVTVVEAPTGIHGMWVAYWQHIHQLAPLSKGQIITCKIIFTHGGKLTVCVYCMWIYIICF